MPTASAESARATTKARPTAANKSPRAIKDQVEDIVAWLKRNGSQRNRDGMARYAIPSDRAFGVSVGVMQKYAKQLGKNHDVAMALWETGWYEARMTAAFLGEPDRLTSAEMDRWCRDFDNWAVCDHACFHLFDRSPHAWSKVMSWSRRRGEFQKRAAYALLASLALHDKKAPDARFSPMLKLIERDSSDERNFVKKGISWALRLIGRRNQALNAASVALSRRLADSSDPTARWLGKSALKELTSAGVLKKLKRRA
jgi:3-methyladenine DNA glycosylase AlkD